MRKKRLVSRGKLTEEGLHMTYEMKRILGPFFLKYLPEYDRHDLECFMMKEVQYTSTMAQLHLEAKGKN